MKLRKEDIQSISEEPLQLFYQGIKSQVTKEKYTRTLMLEDVKNNEKLQEMRELFGRIYLKNSDLRNRYVERIERQWKI